MGCLYTRCFCSDRFFSRCLWATFLLALLAVGDVAADDFRVESSVFEGDAGQPESSSTTLFYGGKVYDYLSDPAEATVYDPGQARFLLLDPKRRLRAEVPLNDLEQFNQQLRLRARQSGQPLLMFLAEPRFDEHFDRDKARFTSEWIRYEATTAASNENMARQYADFVDWQARLNAMSYKGSPPPFGRMAVNAALRLRSCLPREIVRTTYLEGSGGNKVPVRVRSEHRVRKKLSRKDTRRIEQTERDLTELTLVPFAAFQRQ